MNLYLKASLVALALIAAAVFGWTKFKENSEADRPQHQLIEQLETQGAFDFEAQDIEGRPFKLSQYKGSVVILNFWASWCGPCVEEVPSLIKLVEEMKGKVKVVAISGDTQKSDIDVFLKSFPKFKSENIVIVWDKDSNLAAKYGVDRLPESFVLGKDLKLIKKIIGSIGWYSKDSIAYMEEIYKK